MSTGHIVMVAAGILGASLTFGVLHTTRGGTAVVVANHAINAGDVLRDGDFRVERIEADRALVENLVGGRATRRLAGTIAVAPIAEDSVIPRVVVRAPAASGGLRSMSIPIDPSRAVGGRLAAGDQVDVLFAGRDTASIIVNDARVLAVDDREHSAIGGSTRPFTVTIAVDADESLLVAAAIADGNVSIARTTGATSSRGTAPVSVSRIAPPTTRP